MAESDAAAVVVAVVSGVVWSPVHGPLIDTHTDTTPNHTHTHAHTRNTNTGITVFDTTWQRRQTTDIDAYNTDTSAHTLLLLPLL